MTISVQRIDEGERAALAAHFVALPTEDRRLRFGSSISSEAIAAYVDSIDFDRDAVFGVYDDDLVLVGVAHVALGEELAELGLSVLPGHRGRGTGSALFDRAMAHARNRFIPRLFMHCLTENTSIMRIARRSGMDIVTDAGDADAHLELTPASPASITKEFVTDRFALYDYALKAHVAAWRDINAALEAAASTKPVRSEGPEQAEG
ncbi:MAG TPA: GNAT family N-acetyltransferase [Casimicrobiaceae bacterium]|jgi:GNAT superfamily N-acetyltransferase